MFKPLQKSNYVSVGTQNARDGIQLFVRMLNLVRWLVSWSKQNWKSSQEISDLSS